MRVSGSMEVVGVNTRAAVSSLEANLDISSGRDLMIADRYSFSVTVTPTAASSSRLTRIWPRNVRISPPRGQRISENAVSKSASAYWLFTLNSVLTLVQRSLAEVRDFKRTAVESGRRWESRYLATISSCLQSATAFSSASVEVVALAGTGQGVVPSKCPHFWLASIASWKRMEKIAQLDPLGSRRGMEVGRGSDMQPMISHDSHN